jgi:imidazolonepropionase-like amidohydrolase
MKVFRCANVFSGETKGGFKQNWDIFVEDSRIVKKEPADPSMTADVDFSNPELFVVPGLIDTHLHLAHGGTDISEKSDPDPLVALRMAHNAYRNLQAGITTVRDMGAKNHIDVRFRRGVELGLVPSPRVYICGQPIITTGGHCYYMGREADGADEVAKAVREQLKAQVDYIKLMVTGGIVTPGVGTCDLQLRKEEIESAVTVAHNAGKMVSSHAQGGMGVRLTIECGVDILEHGIYLSEDDIEQMLTHGTFYIPTLTAIREIADDGKAVGLPDWVIEKAKSAVESHIRSYQLARKAGVTIAAGTDYRPGTLVDELLLMVKYGASNEEALQAATTMAAKVIGKGSMLGSLDAGKYADLTVVRGNPIEDGIRCLKNVETVIIGGKVAWQKGWHQQH